MISAATASRRRGYIYNAYIQYDGLKPFHFRVGAYTPSEGMEDDRLRRPDLPGARPPSADIARNIAGAPGREGRRASSRRATTIWCRCPTPARRRRHLDRRRRRHLRRAAGLGRPRLLAGGQQARCEVAAGWPCHPCLQAGRHRRQHRASRTPFSFSNGPELAHGRQPHRQHRQYRRQPGDASSALKPRPNMTGFYAPGRLVPLRHRAPHRRCPIRDFSGWYAVPDLFPDRRSSIPMIPPPPASARCAPPSRWARRAAGAPGK